jgi:hypothetical protein
MGKLKHGARRTRVTADTLEVKLQAGYDAMMAAISSLCLKLRDLMPVFEQPAKGLKTEEVSGSEATPPFKMRHATPAGDVMGIPVYTTATVPRNQVISADIGPLRMELTDAGKELVARLRQHVEREQDRLTARALGLDPPPAVDDKDAAFSHTAPQATCKRCAKHREYGWMCCPHDVPEPPPSRYRTLHLPGPPLVEVELGYGPVPRPGQDRTVTMVRKGDSVKYTGTFEQPRSDEEWADLLNQVAYELAAFTGDPLGAIRWKLMEMTGR